MKKQFLAKVGRRLARPVRLYTLWHSRDPYLQLFASSAQAALTGALTSQEKAWTARIEQLRAELESSTERVTRTDFGAGLRAARQSANGSGAGHAENGARVEDEVQRIARFSSKRGIWALFLFKLIRELRPQRCIEMGTALGLSGAYQAAALALNGRGTLTSLEGSAELAAIARRNWEALGLHEQASVVVGKFASTLGGVFSAQAPIDYVFVDGHHDENATLDYFEQLVPHLASPACLVFDDIAWSDGMRRAWRTIAGDRRIKVSVDFGMMGVAIAGDANKQPPRRAPLV